MSSNMDATGAGSDSGHDQELDRILGLDPEPAMSAEASARLRKALAEARQDKDLDRVLELDTVVVPAGLGDRVVHAVRQKRTRRWPLHIVAPILAAAAALVLWIVGGSGPMDPAGGLAGGLGGGSEALVAGHSPDVVSDELLASLTLLENFDYLADELDPFEADALFLMSAEDALLLELFGSDLTDAGYGNGAAK